MSDFFTCLFYLLTIVFLFECKNSEQAQPHKGKITDKRQEPSKRSWIFREDAMKNGKLPKNDGIKSVWGIQNNYFDFSLG